MKKSVRLVLFIAIVVFSSFSSSFARQQIEYKKIYRLGVAPLVKEGVQTVEKLREVVMEGRDVISMLLGGEIELIDEFYKQFPQTTIDEFYFDRFDRFKMIAMSWRDWEKRPRITPPVEWAGNNSVAAFIFKINYSPIKKSHFFLVPWTCGNITLWKIEDLPAPEIKIEKPASVPVKVSAPIIVPVIEKVIPAEPEKKDEIQEKPQELKTIQQNKMDCFVDVGGGIFRSCYKEYVSLRIGFRKNITKNLEFNCLVGAYLPLNLKSDTADWRAVFTGDMGLIFRPSSLFLGIGTGISSAMKNDTEKQFEGIGIIGYSFGKIDLFAEGRVPVHNGEKISKNNKILFGAKLHLGK